MRSVIDLTHGRARALARQPVGGGGLMAPLISNQDGTPKHQRGFTTPILVTDASILALPIDLDRQFLELDNNDLIGVVWCSWGIPAIVGRGFKLAPNGGGRLFDFNCPTAALYMIGSIASNNNVAITTG
jgi:hypothetical protein